MANKSGRQIDLAITIDAPIEEVWKALTSGEGIRNWFCLDAKVNNPGPAGSVWLSFGEGMDWESQIGAWDENHHVSWVDEYERSGEKVRMAVDFYLTTEKGQTKVRLVHSGFGDDSSWDGEIEGLKGGWSYFIYHLKHFLECHLDGMRRVAHERIPLMGDREQVWSRVFSATAGLFATVPGEWVVGAACELALGGGTPYEAVVRTLFPGRTMGLEIPELNQALLLIELEPGAKDSHCGFWLSTVDVDQADEVETNFKKSLNKLK